MVLLTFNVEWFDSSAQMVREYRLHCYENATIEIIEVRAPARPSSPYRRHPHPPPPSAQTGTRRTFLKRISYPQIQPDDLYLGSTVTVFTRQLQIVGYCDTGTRDYVESHRVPTTFAIDVKGGGDAALSSALNLVATEAPLSRAKMVQLGAGRCLLVQVLLPNAAAVERLVALSDGALSAVADADKLFAAPACMEQTDACTLCMIKPHLTRGKDVGKLLQDLVARGYALGGLESFSLSRCVLSPPRVAVASRRRVGSSLSSLSPSPPPPPAPW